MTRGPTVVYSSALHPGGILLSGIRKIFLTNLKYVYVRVPSCRALVYRVKATLRTGCFAPFTTFRNVQTKKPQEAYDHLLQEPLLPRWPESLHASTIHPKLSNLSKGRTAQSRKSFQTPSAARSYFPLCYSFGDIIKEDNFRDRNET